MISSSLNLQSPEVLTHSRPSRDVFKRNEESNEFSCSYVLKFCQINGLNSDDFTSLGTLGNVRNYFKFWFSTWREETSGI